MDDHFGGLCYVVQIRLQDHPFLSGEQCGHHYEVDDGEALGIWMGCAHLLTTLHECQAAQDLEAEEAGSLEEAFLSYQCEVVPSICGSGT